METIKKPKVFISYSWSSPEHQDWVLDLAEKLHEDNIDPIIDKWDLREGQSVIEFMESMVVDPSIDKIIMVIDNSYQTKADSRGGGVGAESTILSTVLYNKKGTSNIVAVIAEPAAKPPVFYSGRIFIDLSSDDKYIENYESLVRWIYGKFKFERPKTQGTTPSFIHENDSNAILYTNNEFRFALDAIEKGKPTYQGLIKQFLNKLDSEIPKLSLWDLEDKKKGFLDNFTNFSAHLLEYKKLLNTICEYNLEPKIIAQFQKFLEGLLKHPGNEKNPLSQSLFESINYLILLTTIAILIKNDGFAHIKSILNEIYEIPSNHPNYHSEKYTTFKIFNPDDSKIIGTVLDKENYTEPLAQLIYQLSDNEIISFTELCEADLLLYLKSATKTLEEKREFIMWWPHLTLYINNQRHPTKMFARAESSDYLEQVCKILGCIDISVIEKIIETSKEEIWGSTYIPQWRSPFKTLLNIKTLTNFEKLKPS